LRGSCRGMVFRIREKRCGRKGITAGAAAVAQSRVFHCCELKVLNCGNRFSTATDCRLPNASPRVDMRASIVRRRFRAWLNNPKFATDTPCNPPGTLPLNAAQMLFCASIAFPLCFFSPKPKKHCQQRQQTQSIRQIITANRFFVFASAHAEALPGCHHSYVECRPRARRTRFFTLAVLSTDGYHLPRGAQLNGQILIE